MTAILTLATVHGPHIDWAEFMPFLILSAGALIVLLAGLLPGRVARERVVPLLTIITLALFIADVIARFDHHASIISGALAVDDLALTLDLIFAVSALASVVIS